MSEHQPDLHRHATAAAFFAATADRIAAQLELGLQERGSASFAVPGGTTPGPIFDLLAKRPLDWSRVTVTLTDERWVPATDSSSNERLVRDRLLTGPASACRLVPLYNLSAKPGLSVGETVNKLRSLDLPFDVVLLGMGGDGHFASLFPGMPNLAQGLDADGESWLIASDQPINGQPRISLSLSLLLQSQLIVLIIRGADKLAVIERARTALPTDLPIAAILQQSKVPVEIQYSNE
jgi:6-phosphogluconolactonase